MAAESRLPEAAHGLIQDHPYEGADESAGAYRSDAREKR